MLSPVIYHSLFTYLFVLSYSLLIGHLFCALFDYLFCFISFDYSFVYCSKEKNHSDPERCSGISILLTVHHHQYESINIIQQTPLSLS
jgi:hypothetical protein